MRIHIQNPEGEPLFDFSEQQWNDAAARAADVSSGHHVTYGKTDAEFAAGIAEAEALITDTGTVRKHFPVEAPNLRVIQMTSAGLDRLAPFTWLPDGVLLLNNRGVHERKAGEFAIMALLMLASRVPEFVTAQREGRWEKRWGTVLSGSRLVCVGLGTLGTAAVRHAKAFGMHVTGVRATDTPHPDCDRVATYRDFEWPLAECDYLLLACPLTDATRNLIDRRRIGFMRPGAGIVNIGRGGLIDQDALCDALDEQRLCGAVLDVFTPEPVPSGHRLWTTRNLIMSPHTCADDPATYNINTLDVFFSNLRAIRDGVQPPNLFDVERGY